MHISTGFSVRRSILVLAVGVLMATLTATPVFAQGAHWKISSYAAPTNLPPGGEGQIDILVENLDDGSVDAANIPVTVTDNLPQQLRVTAISGVTFSESRVNELNCFPSPVPHCTFAGLEGLAPYPETLAPYGDLEVRISVKVEEPLGTAASLPNEATVEGGEEAPPQGGDTPSASLLRPLTINGGAVPFGVEQYGLLPEDEAGTPDTQAGSHPFQLTSSFALNTKLESGVVKPAALPKDLHFSLPPGLVGDANAVPQCTEAQFVTIFNGRADLCPADTAVGVVSVTISEPHELGTKPYTSVDPLFNLTPSPGEPARFGFLGVFVPIALDTSVRTGGDYGVTVSSDNIIQTAGVLSTRVTFWGVPGESVHNASRGWACLDPVYALPGEACVSAQQPQPPAFLTLPTSCTGQLTTTVTGDSWPVKGNEEALEDDTHVFGEDGGQLLGVGGCNDLSFNPSIGVEPDERSASTPTGMKVKVNVPQETTLAAAGLAEADVKDTTVALPTGVQMSPSAATGLQTCSNAQIGFKGVNPQTGTDEFTSELPKPLEPGVNFCPESSKIASVKIKTPLLSNPLEGAVYLAAPQNFAGPPPENPFGSLIAMYLVAKDPISGVLVKLAGKVTPNPETGQLTTTFENTPQLPFEELTLDFFGGERAPLSTPALCGAYTTSTSIAPWSEGETATPSSSFAITTGPDGTGPSGCSAPRPFAPGFQAGSTNLQAGTFTPLTATLTRPDADQPLGGVEMQLPAGFSGMLSEVKLCPAPAASAGTCGPESLIGETVISAGLGGDPYTVTGGKVFITTGYKGAPYGLSIVNPASAGPFVLEEGRPIVVRASVFVDPHTAALRIVSDPLPTILDGIPLQIQHVNVTATRPGFTFNPTNCSKTAIGGMLRSSEGTSVAVSTPFQVANCATLAFKPKFAASTAARSSKAKGASLTVKLTYPKTSQGTEANIAKVKVDLPKQLPSRLTTLQKACLAKVFEANPANCPAASIVGHAKAITPILPVPLEGPAYFVSHGDEAFPSLIMVLQGYGVTIDLVGTTNISKAGITSSTFKAVPDVPVGSFELTLPEGKYSALGANLPVRARGDFCGTKLAMPTAFVGQNGAEIHESTPVAVSGCTKSKQAKKGKGKHGKKPVRAKKKK